MQVVVDQLLTQYELSGKGPLVLLLHGWGDTAAGLAGLRKTLSEDYQVLALDLPGFGGTNAPKDVWDLDDYGRFVHVMMKKLELKQPYAVIGHSNGGALAIRAISQGVLAPEKLVLIAASGIRTGNGLKRLALKIIAKTGNVATIWMPERYRRALRQSLYGVAGSDMLVVPQLQETFKKTVRQDVQADAAKVGQPTLLIYAERDRAVPLADGKAYHHLIKNSKLEVINSDDHFVHQAEPAKVTGLIEEFLK
jgi:pimeloyl-ACP methyl ester carboxylesterase